MTVDHDDLRAKALAATPAVAMAHGILANEPFNDGHIRAICEALVAASPATVLSLLDEIAALKADARRFDWFFGEADKVPFLPTYWRGCDEKWTPDQWRAAIDRAIAMPGGER